MMALKSKWVLLVLLPTIQDYIQDYGMEGLGELNELADYIKQKTGFDLMPDWLEGFLDSLINNSEMFMVMLVAEYSDILAEQAIQGLGRFSDSTKAMFANLTGGA